MSSRLTDTTVKHSPFLNCETSLGGKGRIVLYCGGTKPQCKGYRKPLSLAPSLAEIDEAFKTHTQEVRYGGFQQAQD